MQVNVLYIMKGELPVIDYFIGITVFDYTYN